MKAIKSIFYATLISVICSNSYSADISGDYKCAVFDPKSNSHYDEKLNISKTGDTYRLQYYQVNSNTSIPYLIGTGIVTGNALAAINWESGATWVGGSLFAIKPDGSLDGTWATANTTLVGTETCSKS